MNNVFDFFAAAIEMENWEKEPLENVSSDYYHALQKAESRYRQIQKILQPEMQDTLAQLSDDRDRMEIAGMDVYYRKGFCDAIRLIMQTLVWEPRKS